MNLQKLYNDVFDKAQKFGEKSTYSLSCEQLMLIIRYAQAAQQSVHADECDLCGKPATTVKYSVYCDEHPRYNRTRQ
jgi:hypothetical protein